MATIAANGFGHFITDSGKMAALELPSNSFLWEKKRGNENLDQIFCTSQNIVMYGNGQKK